MDDEHWWPTPDKWPAYPEGPLYEDVLWRPGMNEALALLILEGIVFAASPCHQCGGSPRLSVECNDLFYWACASAEGLPPLGFGYDEEKPFWHLYDLVREHGVTGSHIWCCLRRGLRPQTPIVESWKRSGLWSSELEALPAPEPS